MEKFNLKSLQLPKKYRYMDVQELVKSIAPTTKVCCWASADWTNIDDLCLRFTVDANHFKGTIFIVLNFMDLFEVYLVHPNGDLYKSFKDVYIEDLIATIDNEIEKIDSYKW